MCGIEGWRRGREGKRDGVRQRSGIERREEEQNERDKRSGRQREEEEGQRGNERHVWKSGLEEGRGKERDRGRGRVSVACSRKTIMGRGVHRLPTHRLPLTKDVCPVTYIIHEASHAGPPPPPPLLILSLCPAVIPLNIARL